MEVYYDFELNEKLEQPKNPDNIVLKTLREFAKARYKVFEDEIDSIQTKDNPAFIVLGMHDGRLEISRFNIPPHLVDKIIACITEDDYNYITNVLIAKMNEEIRKN
jgi:hypothetical protein